jgi:hypothetical protein
MDLTKIIADLRAERASIEEALLVLERLGGPRRGRKPAWMAREGETTDGANGLTEAPRKRRFSAETRRKMAEAQKRRWAAQRKSE